MKEKLRAKWPHLWPPFLSAFLMLGAYAPFNLIALVFVGLIPWFLSLRNPNVRPFRSGYAFGFWYMLGQMFWIQQFVTRWTGDLFLGALPCLLGVVLASIYFGLAGWVIAMAWQRKLPWLIPILWVGVETFRSFIPVFAFPWGLVASPLWRVPQIIQTAHYGGIFLVSGMVVMVNVAIAQIIAGEGFKKARPLLLAAAAMIAISLFRYYTPPQGVTKRVVVVQPGFDMAFGNPDGFEPWFRRVIPDFYQQARRDKADFMVLPEGISEGNDSMPPPTPFNLELDVPIVFGGKRGVNPSFQTAYAWDGKRWTYADKTRLVIFGEFVPGRSWIPFLSAFKLPAGDLKPADHISSVDMGDVRLGPVICFEGLFPDVAFNQAKNGAQLLTVMSIDDWYFGTNAPDQLMSFSIWRSVENGLPLVRSGSLGYTLALDARGNVLKTAPLSTPYALTVDVKVPEKGQAFALAPVLPVLCVIAVAFVPFYHRYRKPAQAKSLSSDLGSA